MDFIKKLADWPFLQEPIYRWFIFLVILTLFSAVWAMITGYMKG